MIRLSHEKPNFTGVKDDSRPVAVYDFNTGKLLGNFPTLTRVANYFLGRRNTGMGRIVDSFKKSGKPKTMNDRNGNKIYLKSIRPEEFKSAK